MGSCCHGADTLTTSDGVSFCSCCGSTGDEKSLVAVKPKRMLATEPRIHIDGSICRVAEGACPRRHRGQEELPAPAQEVKPEFTENQRALLQLMTTYMKRIMNGEISSIGIVTALSNGGSSSAYVVPTDDDSPEMQELVHALHHLEYRLSKTMCATCGTKHHELMCPGVWT